MTKAYSKAAKRRAKAEMPVLAASPKRGKDKCFIERTRQQPQDKTPDKAALEARCKMQGIRADADNRTAMRAPYAGSDQGRCIAHGKTHDQAMRVWQVWQGYGQANLTYQSRYIGQSENPKGATLAMAPDRMETDQSHSVDLRDQDERDRDAVSNYMRWEGLMMKIDRKHMAAIKAARTVPEGVLWSDTAPTLAGYRFAEAIQALARVSGA